MKIYIVCSVRDANKHHKNYLELYANLLESDGHKVHLPHRDTNQEATGYNICCQNYKAIKEADEIAVFYDETSQGSHFDLGIAFALNKKIRVFTNKTFDEHKSFPRMLAEWQSKIMD